MQQLGAIRTAIHSHSHCIWRRRGLQLSTHRVLPNSAHLPPAVLLTVVWHSMAYMSSYLVTIRAYALML
jgi:hypothetical protein